jgi:hypothetical protein
VGYLDLDTNIKKSFREGDEGWREDFDQCRLFVGHNIIGYDFPAMYKIFKWRPHPAANIHDTMLMSQAQNYRRFMSGTHKLEDWGNFLGYPKGDHSDWSKWTPDMQIYWERDIDLNKKVYDYLLGEFRVLIGRNIFFKKSLQNEHMVAKFCARAHEVGWLFDKKSGHELLAEMKQALLDTEAIIVPKLLVKTVAIDKVKGEVEPKKPKWLKNGCYDIHTCKYFGITPESGKDEDNMLVVGPYSRIEFVNPTLKNMEDVKTWLFSIGWEPDDWNLKKEPDGTWRKVSPKLSESSLLALGPDGELINDYTTTKSRHSILEGWLSSLDENDRIRGGCFTIATPTGRARHSEVCNVPGAEAPWGKQIRSLFIADPGWKIVGADSSGNQFRALCHYLKNDKYTELVLTGDVHQENANVLTDILQDIGVYNSEQKVPRKTAKPFIYAFLFGAGGEKLSLIVLGTRNKKIGNKLKNEFIKRVPGLEQLVDKVTKFYYKTEQYGKPYIPGADGRRVYCDSPHKALNYLLQDFEAISCKAAVAYIMEKCEKEGVPYIPLIWYHDEFEIMVPEEHAEKVREWSIEAYRESGKEFGMMILDGAGKVGDSWYDVH